LFSDRAQADTCAKRLENICRQIAEDPLPAHEVLPIIEGTMHGTAAEVEDAVIMCAYRRYEVFGSLKDCYGKSIAPTLS
jgi:hypothetical protein